MRYLIIIYSLLTTLAFAISCPNNGNILDTGYTINQVLQICGQPVSRNDYTITTKLSEEWIYYKMGMNNTNKKVTILFNKNHIANINIFSSSIDNNLPIELNVSSSGICGSLIQSGNSTGFVRSVCGNPAVQNVLQRDIANVSELTYDTGSPIKVLIFKNSKLIDWK